ncbi:hypothetical protein [Secundilactobacillus pentosiphilus]|uniref:hypothetical protein n=1 Tax=Secundilactobacillus pentosiphilus TaxID=1714682 RepID=UPI0015E0CA31|nr:hypothetical protein [Secundilactobacillus pentosiphilus]
MLGYEIVLGLIAVISLLALFDDTLLGDRQKYQQFGAVCIASVVCWTLVMLFQLYLTHM